jgi:RNA polymerase sigma factor (sigma-70 family)
LEGVSGVSVPEPEDRDLADLVERAQAREAGAERELHDRFRRFVHRRLEEARRRRNWFWLTDVEAAVQEVFSQFFTALRGGKFAFQGKHRLEGFLVRTAWFVAMNLKDRANRDKAVSLFDDEEGGLRFDVAAFGAAVYEQLDRKECLEMLGNAVGELNESRREVVERTLLGQKVREICAATGKTPASVSGLKFNAFTQLRKRLTALGFVEKCGELFGVAGGGGDA